MADYLLDTNYLIYAFDDNADKVKKKECLEHLQELLQKGNEFYLTPLIRYEVLRNIDFEDEEKLKQLENALVSTCKTLDISDEVSDLARDLYRFDIFKSKENNIEKNFEKRKFDIFHYATAKVNHIELLSKDTDISKIDALYNSLQLLKIL